jgi:hypothetical protein
MFKLIRVSYSIHLDPILIESGLFENASTIDLSPSLSESQLIDLLSKSKGHVFISKKIQKALNSNFKTCSQKTSIDNINGFFPGNLFCNEFKDICLIPILYDAQKTCIGHISGILQFSPSFTERILIKSLADSTKKKIVFKNIDSCEHRSTTIIEKLKKYGITFRFQNGKDWEDGLVFNDGEATCGITENGHLVIHCESFKTRKLIIETIFMNDSL